MLCACNTSCPSCFSQEVCEVCHPSFSLLLGKGLTMVVSILKGNFTEMVAETIAAKQTLKRFVKDSKVQGFCKVISSSKINDGLAYV